MPPAPKLILASSAAVVPGVFDALIGKVIPMREGALVEKTAWRAWLALSVLALLLGAVSCGASPGGGRASRWDEPVNRIEDTLERAVASYEAGDQGTAEQLSKDAYFDAFESSGMEAAIRLSISARRASEVEFAFGDVRRLVRTGARSAEVRAAVSTLMTMLREDAAHLGGGEQGGGAADFAVSFLIIVREGFEAILIIGAIIAYLVKSGNGDKVRTIYQSALAALLASLATAVAIRYLFAVSGASQELLEGATMLLASAVLFSVSFWLLGKVHARQWQQFIQSKVERSLTTGSTFALWFAAFLAVYREGAETALFYQALVSSNGGNSIGAIGLGFGAGVIVLAAIFVAIRWGSLRIPIRPFFGGTSALLYLMAFIFAGGGVTELQEAGVIAASRIPGLGAIDLLGIHPTWESLALQAALLLAAVIGVAYQYLRKYRPADVARSPAT